jgi:hypothetical protein
MANPDVSLITANAFVEFGGQVFAKRVLNWKLRQQGIQVRTNVTKPQVLTKLSAAGAPRPYSAADNTTSNGVQYSDRVLTVYNSKWDHDFDPEEYRNTYLGDGVTDMSFAQAATNQIAKEYLDSIIRNTLWLGSHNAGGSTPAAICTGWGTLIAAEIVALTLTPVATGVVTVSNAVESFEAVAEAVPVHMRDNEDGIIEYCSYAMFDFYTKNYRNLNGFGFSPSVTGDYKMDNKNVIIRPVPWIPASSQRIVATVAGNLVFGTDVENIRVAASVRRNIIESRPMMAAGCQIQDLDVLVVNDQA